MAALVAAVQLLPCVIAAPVFAGLADRHPPGRVLVAGYVGIALGMAATTAVMLAGAPPAAVYVAAIVAAVPFTIVRPTQLGAASERRPRAGGADRGERRLQLERGRGHRRRAAGRGHRHRRRRPGSGDGGVRGGCPGVRDRALAGARRRPARRRGRRGRRGRGRLRRHRSAAGRLQGGVPGRARGVAGGRDRGAGRPERRARVRDPAHGPSGGRLPERRLRRRWDRAAAR